MRKIDVTDLSKMSKKHPCLSVGGNQIGINRSLSNLLDINPGESISLYNNGTEKEPELYIGKTREGEDGFETNGRHRYTRIYNRKLLYFLREIINQSNRSRGVPNFLKTDTLIIPVSKIENDKYPDVYLLILREVFVQDEVK